jgi:AcrR family transcriptional regulator
MQGLRERKSARARAATLDAGFRLFDERGYDQVTVADICEAADIGRRTFFHYFPTKEDLLGAPAQEMAVRLTAVLAQAPPAATDAQALREALFDLARYTLATRDRFVLYRRILVTSTTLRVPAFWNLPAQELRTAQQLAARHGDGAAPGLGTRLLVARAVAAFRLWLDITLEGDPVRGIGPDFGEPDKVGGPETGAYDGDAEALRMLARIFDADPLLAEDPQSRLSASG